MEVIIVCVIIGLLPAYIAKKKGRSFGLWWFYGAMIFIIALPHALIMRPLPGSDADNKLEADRAIATGRMPNRDQGVDFVANGVMLGTPYRNEPDGTVVAIIGERAIRFKSVADLEAMLSHKV